MTSAAAYIELDYLALHHNVQKVREYAPTSKVMAVIKANAYGHGIARIAHQLEGAVDAFAVARLDEAVRLREANVQSKILVLQGINTSQELTVAQRHQLDIVVHCEMQIEQLEAAVLPQLLNIWLKIDTGMNRLGILSKQLASLLLRLQRCSVVHPSVCFMTHFANADDIHDDKTGEQIAFFNEILVEYAGEKSSANSAGLTAWPEARQDWVRPGLMLYGVSPLLEKTAKQLSLQPVMSFYSRVIAIKQVKRGDAVGYGSGWVAEKQTLIAVVSIGYGDGYPREVRTGTPVLIGHQRVPLIGRVSMDMLTLDISDHVSVKVGDPVMLWGNKLPIEEIAACAGTIPYTLLCGITARVRVLGKGC